MHLMRPTFRTIVRALPLVGTVACYAPVPIEPTRAPDGSRVSLALTSQGTRELASQLGPDVVRVEGEVARVTADTVELRLVRTERASGIDELWQRQRIAVARPLVATVVERRLSRGRTWLLGGGALVAVIVAGSHFVTSGGLFGDGGGATHTAN